MADFESPLGRVRHTNRQQGVLSVTDETPYGKKLEQEEKKMGYDPEYEEYLKAKEQERQRVMSLQAQPQPLQQPSSRTSDLPTHFHSTPAPTHSQPAKLDFKELENLRKGEVKAPDHARSSLELLTGIGRAVIDVEVDGHTFSLRSLKSKEQLSVFLEAAKIEKAIDQAFQVKHMTLAHSLFRIDGEDIEIAIRSGEYSDKLNFISEFSFELIDHLYSEQQKITSDNMARFNALGSTDKERVENVKKS